jgi:hypothetical protein
MPPRCSNGTQRNKKTGLCEPKKNPLLRLKQPHTHHQGITRVQRKSVALKGLNATKILGCVCDKEPIPVFLEASRDM